MIALVDIDGTLLHGRPVAHGLGLIAALRDVYGVDVGEADLLAASPGGRTDLQIALLMLEAAGVPEPVAMAGLSAWTERAVARYLEVAGDHPVPVAAPDAAPAMEALAAAGIPAALVTGNIRAIAHHKLGLAGLGGVFHDREGGYGCDAADRAEVVRIALRRAGLGPAEGVVIGDTPRDVSAAHAAGCRVVAVTTGHFGAAELQGADAVAANLLEAVRHAIDLEPR